MRILVTGGVRSGKSAHAERLLADRPDVTYVAAGPVPSVDDAEWAARVALHRQRRPASWKTVESTDLSALPAGPVLIDCLGTWLAAQLDELGAWDVSPPSVVELAETPTPPVVDTLFETRLTAAVAAVAATDDIVIVTNEVGLGVVPEHASGRLFRDLLGTTNQRFAEVCDEVHLVVAGRVLKL